MNANTFKIQALLMISIIFGCFTINTFNIFKLWAELGSKALYLMLVSLFWNLYYASMVFTVLHMGHFTREEVRLRKVICEYFINSHQQAMYTANYLHKLANSDTVGISLNSIAVFSQQILHRVPNFSCGFFSFDLHLAFQVRTFYYSLHDDTTR